LDSTDLAFQLDIAIKLDSLGEALAKPIHPEDSAVEYIPTQYLAEVIKSAGYDGICYPSALNPKGSNVVIFDPSNVRITRKAWVYKLGNAEYAIHPRPPTRQEQRQQKRHQGRQRGQT
jgi:hypothetical protein